MRRTLFPSLTWERDMKAAIIVGAALLALAACTTTGEIEGHKVRGTVPQEQATTTTDLHAEAPQWFKDRWQNYLRIADGNYAVLAVDRNSRGTGYVYCAPGYGGLCRGNAGWTQAFKDTNYKYPALRYCAQDVKNNFPAEKPDCAIYAIKDKIVWQGNLPWETQRNSMATHTSVETANNTSGVSSGLSSRSIAVTWEGHRGVLTGVVTLHQGARSGRMSIELADNKTACEGQFWLTGVQNGQWEIDCGNGLTARGSFTGLGAEKGARGEGTDSRGREIQYILGAADTG